MHAGVQTLLTIIRSRFWPIGGKTTVKQAIFNCIRCYRTSPKIVEQIMGQLPHPRVYPSPVFYHTGVDFFGPFYAKSQVRNRAATKVYMSLFVCFAVKAVHLEVATNLSTEAFLSILTKFISRRPFVSKIYSDNATNFIGAKRQLQELKVLFQSQHHSEMVREMCKHEGIEWLTIPPRSPNFGGLWKASIKQAKILITKAFGVSSYSMDELQRVACQVESILNSRPLMPLSNDPLEFEALTPGHFLTGGQMKAIPSPSFQLENTKHLDRWQNIESKMQGFWLRWRNEYLQTLQTRNKWAEKHQNIEVGSLVLMKEENVPTLKWPMGRVISTRKGSDGYVRVVDVRTAFGIFTRAISKICKLPVEEDILEAEPSKAAGMLNHQST